MQPIFIQYINRTEYGFSKHVPIRKNKSKYLINLRCSSRESKDKAACKASGLLTTENKGIGLNKSILKNLLRLRGHETKTNKKEIKGYMIYPFNTFCLIWEMWAKKRSHEWLGGVLGVLGLAPSTHISQIKQKVLKGYMQ